MSRARARTERGWARREDFLNELSDLRRAAVELSDRVAVDYLSHAVACFAKGRDQAGEVWLRLAVDRLRAQTRGVQQSEITACLRHAENVRRPRRAR